MAIFDVDIFERTRGNGPFSNFILVNEQTRLCSSQQKVDSECGLLLNKIGCKGDFASLKRKIKRQEQLEHLVLYIEDAS